MKKFLLSIFAVLFAFAGAQAQEVVYTLEPAIGSNNSYAGNCDITIEGITWNLTGNSTMLPWRIGGKNLTGVDRAVYSKTAMESAVSKVVLTTGTYNLSAVNSAKLLVANNADFTGAVEYSFTFVASSDIEIPISAAAGSYYKFVFNVSAGNSNKYLQFAGAKFYSAEGTGEGGGETPETPVAPAAPTLPAACSFDDAMTVEITGIAEGATAYYSLNNETDWVEGTSVEITETTTVYAKVVKDELSSGVVSETYTKNTPVTPPAEGEVVDVLTRELTGISGTSYSSWSGKTVSSSAVYAGQSAGGNDAIQLRSNNSNSGIVTTASGGKVKKIVVEWNSNTAKGRTLNVYGKNTAYSAATDLYSTSTQGTLLGTIVCGTSTELVIDGDYEYIGMHSNSGAMYLTSISITWDESAGVTPVAPNAPILPASTTFKGSMSVEITGIAADATVYYTTDESDPATSDTRVEYTEPFEITATTTVKAVAVNEVGTSEMATATYTLFVVEETAGYYIKVVSAPADWSGKYLIVYEDGTYAYVFNGKDEANGYVSAVTDGDVIKANSEIDAVAVTIAAMEGGYSVKTADGYIYGASGSNKLNTNASEPQLNTIEFTADGVNIEAGRYLRFNSAVDDMRFRYYNSTFGESVQLYKYVEELPLYHTLTVTEAGYATLFLGFNARIPSAVEAYTVTTVNNGWVSLTQVTGVLPSNQGVIIKASAGDYKFFYEETATADVTDNLLKGTLYNENIEGPAYVLANGVNGVGLYKAQLTDGMFLNNANKAYLPASAVPNMSAAFYGFDWNGTTGIDQITDNREQSTVIFDLTGRKVNSITAPGIYIVGGKKVLVK